ncbi:hypothetical protein ACWDWO_24575 [Actinopolymorpha singaporensis]
MTSFTDDPGPNILFYCLAMGIEDANDTGYRQAVAPDAIQGRMNSTIRTVNRVVYFFGAAVFVLRELDMPAWAYGVTLAVRGVGGFLVFGQGSVAGPVGQSEHPLAHGEAGGSVAELHHDPG